MRTTLEENLQAAGFLVPEPRPGLKGENPLNICNRGRSGAGGQLEVSEGLRAVFREDPSELGKFVRAVREVILDVEVSTDWEGEGADS